MMRRWKKKKAGWNRLLLALAESLFFFEGMLQNMLLTKLFSPLSTHSKRSEDHHYDKNDNNHQ